MDDLQELQPGRIKRKNRKNPSESIMNLSPTEPLNKSETTPDMPTVSREQQTTENHDANLLDDLYNILKPADEPVPTETGIGETPSSEANTKASPAPHDAGQTPSSSWLRGIQGENQPTGGSIADLLQSGSTTDALAPAPSESQTNAVSPLDLLDTARSETKAATGRDDVRKLTPTARRKSQAQTQDAAAPVPDAVETTIQRASKAADKTLEALAQLQAATDRAERRHFFNSAAAYVLFCVILTLGLYYALNYRASARYAYQAVNQERYEKLLNAKKILDAEFERDQRASSEAYEVYQLIEQGRYEESIERYIKVQANMTHPAESALLAQKIDEIRWRLADNAYHDGIILFREQNYDQARDAFYKSQTYKENTSYTHMLNYYLATCLFQLGDFEGARGHFEKAQESGQLNSEFDANARYYRAVCAEKVGDVSEAYTQYDQFTRKYRYHKNADEANRAKARLEKTRPKD
jgi:tetratricopeptide (TPR) repeat protein